MDSDTKLAYQTRDGRVSIFDLRQQQQPKKVLEIQTGSQGFCAMAVSKGPNATNNIMALPSDDPSDCTIHDIRQKDSTFHFPGGGVDADHGMLMSLSMVDSIVACGMENGTLCFHDLRKPGRFCSVKLSPNFIIGLDMVPSIEGSMVAVTGMAGNAEDLELLPESERGTVAVVKCSVGPELFEASVRSRVGTCSLSGGGKPGVDVCRFRPDGRLFSIGGWDKRVRLFERSKATPLALLRGHTASVCSLDWASNSLLASGDKDGTIHIWNVAI
jgi:WD40 repeat protein